MKASQKRRLREEAQTKLQRIKALVQEAKNHPRADTLSGERRIAIYQRMQDDAQSIYNAFC